MTPVDDKTMAKLRKIQALADRAGTEGEAQAAMTALQNLLSKHGLSKSDITSETILEEDVNQLVVDTIGVKQHWRGWLGGVIADNFRCECYWSHGWDRKTGRSNVSLMFIGFETEVALAQAAYQTAVLTMGRLRDNFLYDKADEMKAMGRRWDQQDGREASKSYIAGFIEGLSAAFKENVKKNSLVLVKAEKVNKAVMALGLRSGSGSDAYYWGNGSARKAGHEAGLSHGRSSRSNKLDGGIKGIGDGR